MSAWIKLHAAAFGHPKTRRMAKRLGISPAAVVGHLASLWTWALEYAPDGRLGGFEDEELEVAAGWDGQDGAFLEAALVAGYLEHLEAELHIHDWDDYAGALLARRRRNREYMRAARGQGVESTCAPRGHHVETTRDHVDCIADPRGGLDKSREELKPISSSPGSDEGLSAVDKSPSAVDNPITTDDSASAIPDDGFAEFWAAYPRKLGKAETEKRWAKMSASSRRAAFAAALHLARYAGTAGVELRYIPYPATFIGPKRLYEDWAHGPPAGYEAPAAASKREACPECETDLTYDDERRPHCPLCGWRPA